MKYFFSIATACAVALVFVIGFSHFADAQITPTLGASNFTITLTQNFGGSAKDFPGPHESYSAAIQGSTVDLNRSTIVWTKNGVVVLRGPGAKTYPYTTGALGTRDTLAVSIAGPDGARYAASKTIAINDTDLVWFAETAAPPWYAGKALASPSSRIRVVAMPDIRKNGTPMPPSQLIYRWKRDGAIVASASGAGKQSFIFTGDVLPGTQSEITLEITDLAKTVGAQKTIAIPLIQPILRVYAEDLLEGTLTNQPITELRMISDSRKSVRAIPFFFSGIGALTYEWRVDGKPADAEGSSDLLELAAAAGIKGVSSVRIAVQNPTRILERGSNTFTVYVQ